MNVINQSIMKKVKLYASVALTALLTGCANEDFVTDNPMQTDEARPTANVVLSINENEALTRAWENWGWSSGGYMPQFENGDQLGALLMDTWDGQGYETTNFEFVDYIHTNYPFTRTEGANGEITWNTPENAPVLAGNYFFYLGHNPKFTYRGYVGWSVDPVQKAYNPETNESDPWQAVRDNQEYLGYAFIKPTTEGVNRVNFDFVPLFATPAFQIENRAFELVAERMIIREGSNSGNDINPSTTSKLMATTAMLAPATGKFEEVNGEWENEDYEWHTSKMWMHAQRYINQDFDYPTAPGDEGKSNTMQMNAPALIWNLLEDDLETEATYQYTIDFGPEGQKVDAGETIKAFLVMPGGVYAENEKEIFEAIIYLKNPKTNKRYLVRIPLGTPETQGATNTSSWDDIAAAAGTNFLKPGKTTLFEAAFDAGALQDNNITDYKVSTNEELQWLLEEAAQTAPTALVVTTMGNKVELTPEIYELLKARANYKLYINGTFTLPEGCAEDGINLLNFDNTFINTDLIVASKQVAVKDIENCDITVTETGELDTKSNDVKIDAGFIENKGIIYAGDIKAVKDLMNDGSDIINLGKLTGDKIEATVSNGKGKDGVIVETAHLIVNESVATVYNYAYADVAGTLTNFTNKEGAQLVVFGDLDVINYIGNYGTMQVNDGITVTDLKADPKWKQSIQNFEGGVINNLGAIERVYTNDGIIYNGNQMDTDATLQLGMNNKGGLIYNYSVMKDVVTNNGYILMQAGTAQINFRNENNGNGNIENTLHGDIKNIGAQHVIYTASNQDFATVISDMKTYGKYTDLVIVGEYTLTDEHDISQTTTSETVTAITVDETGVVNIGYNQDVQLGGANISLTNNGKVSVMHGATLRVGKVDNNGTFKVNNHAQVLGADGNDTTSSIEDIERFD